MSRAEAAVKLLLESLIPASEYEVCGLNLENTPRRVVDALCCELLSSYFDDRLIKDFTTFPTDGNTGMVVEGPIEFTSTCAHHLMPFSGMAFVAYLPAAKLIGASKLARVVEYYSHMLQIQERLTRQISEFVLEHGEAVWAGTLVSASHSCMQCRGVKQRRTKMVTTAFLPRPEDDPAFRPVIDEFYRNLTLLE